MANIKEQETSGRPEDIAIKEVEGYIEAVEKQPELQQTPQLQPAPSQTPTPPAVTDAAGQVVMQPAMPSINLPLSEPEVREGLHHPVVEAFRWLSEFCVYLIKKYPGRVFYRSKQTS